MIARIYWNSHRGRWSVADPATRRVLGHARAVSLRAATFTVSEAGRARVLRTRRKNVHAYAAGEVTAITWCDSSGQMRPVVSTPTGVVTYNPYRDASFVTMPDRRSITAAAQVVFGIQACSSSS